MSKVPARSASGQRPIVPAKLANRGRFWLNRGTEEVKSLRRFLVRFLAHPGELAELRDGLRALLVAVPHELCCDVFLGVDEAVANSLIHAHSKKSIAVHASIDAAKITVTFSDSGQGFDVGATVRSWPPTSDAECGRGIYLLATLMDAVTVDVSGGTIVHMSRELIADGSRAQPVSTTLSTRRARFDHRARATSVSRAA